MKLCHAVSLGLGVKGVKIIALNVAKFGVKVRLNRTILLGFGLKELKITMNIVKVGVHTYHPNVHQKK